MACGTPTALVLSFSDLRSDPRVNRQIKALRNSFQVVAAGFNPPATAPHGIRYIELPIESKQTFHGRAWRAALFFSHLYDRYYWQKGWIRNALPRLRECRFDLVVANFANADMVGHSGKLEPTIRACEAVDAQLGRIYKAIKEKNGSWLITAISLRAVSASSTRIGIWRSAIVNFARFTSTSPKVAMRSASEIVAVEMSSSASRSKSGSTMTSGRSSGASEEIARNFPLAAKILTRAVSLTHATHTTI